MQAKTARLPNENSIKCLFPYVEVCKMISIYLMLILRADIEVCFFLRDYWKKGKAIKKKQ